MRLRTVNIATLGELFEGWNQKIEQSVSRAEVLQLARAGRGIQSRKAAEAFLQRINSFGQCCGVEAIGNEASYVNVGDSYTATVVWCGYTHRMYVAAVADWHEARRGREGRFPFRLQEVA